MSLDFEGQIKSLRVTDETLQWLRFKAHRTGKSHPEIAREALHVAAVNEMQKIIEDFNVLNSLAGSEGISRESTGRLKVIAKPTNSEG